MSTGCVNGPRTFHASIRDQAHTVLSAVQKTAEDHRPTSEHRSGSGKPQYGLLTDSAGLSGYLDASFCGIDELTIIEFSQRQWRKSLRMPRINELDGLCVRVNQYDSHWMNGNDLTKNDQYQSGLALYRWSPEPCGLHAASGTNHLAWTTTTHIHKQRLCLL
jgi:hypothetical protein